MAEAITQAAGIPAAAEAAAAAADAVPRHRPPEDLSRYAVLSIVAAVATIALKTYAWRITGSVGLLSDAAESVVNLVAAIVAFAALRVAVLPPDKNHNYGHSKAEYFSAALEGVMIFVAAAIIVEEAVRRLIHPRALESVGLGLAISVVASIINGLVAWVLIRVGRHHRSATLIADGKHLFTDVWTSAGVLVGVGLVWLTGYERLDPIVAMAVGVNILVAGWKLIGHSTAGLMDISLTKEDNAAIVEVLDRFTTGETFFHALRTRESGHRRFCEFHMLVPGAWSVQQGHDAVEDVTAALLDVFPDLRVAIHLEPMEDPRSYQDIGI